MPIVVFDSLIKDIGHLTYNEDGTDTPYFFINDDKSIPHISLYTDKLEYTESRLMIDGNQVHLIKMVIFRSTIDIS